jgi:serine/threonine protein phosphatase PrpC
MMECKEILKKRITDELIDSEGYMDETDIKSKLEDIVNNTDKQIAFDKTCDYKLSGCTFTLVLFYISTFYIVNVGSAHCLYSTLKDSSTLKTTNSKDNLSSMAGSENRVSNLGSEFGLVTKGHIYSTNNPMKAATFLYTVTRELMTKIHNVKLNNFNANIANKIQMEIISTDHSVTNYDELLRLSKEGSIVCKDRKKIDLPYYARPFKFYVNQSDPSLSNWPAMRYSRALGCFEARKIGLISKPSITSKKMIRGKDLYLVIGTDGLWSVMETVEVVYLLLSEIFKGSALLGAATQNVTTPGTALVPNSRSTVSPSKINFPTNKNLAKLLGAFARLRLGNMAAKYKTKFDDLSIVIIGLF